MDVILLTPAWEKAWERFIEASLDATLAHLLGWRNVVEKTYGHTPYYLMAIQGDAVVGLLPLFLIRSKLFGRFLATAPYLSHGGLLSMDSETAGKLVDTAREVAIGERAKYIEIRGLSKVDHGLQLKEKYCTYFLPLNPNPDVVWGQLKRWARWAVRKAIKSGLTVERGSHLVGNLAQLLSHHMRDLGTPFHGEAFYRNILAEFAGHGEVFVVRHGDAPIGGGLTVTVKETLAWIYGGCLKAYRNSAAMSLLTWEIIRYGCCQSAVQLDFGRSRWGSGTAMFKRQWGAKPLPLFYEYQLPGGIQMPDMDPTNPKFQLAIAVWRRLPLSIARVLGPYFIKGLV